VDQTVPNELSGKYSPIAGGGPADPHAAQTSPRELSENARGELHDAGFDLLEEVQRGGFGIVFRAHDRRLQRDVAVKIIDRLSTRRLGTVQPAQEITSLATLRHPHIVPLHTSGTLRDGTIYFVMAWIDGRSLRAVLSRDLQLPIDDVLRIGIDLADALSALHARGLVHRDVKPENVLMDGEHAILVDLGLVSTMKPAAEPGTEPDPLVGTPNYMSPEQWTPGAAIDGRADVYALGCLLYELLTGRVRHESNPLRSRAHNPFAWSDSAHSSDLVDAAVGQPSRVIPRVRDHRADAPLSLERLLHRAMEPEVSDRLASATAFKSALEQIQAERRRAPFRVRGRRALLLSSTLVALVLPPIVYFGARYAATQQLRALDPNRVALLPMLNDTGDARFDAIARRLDGQLREGLAKSLREADGADSEISVVADSGGASPRTDALSIELVRRVALGARSATVVRTRLQTEGGRVVVRAWVIAARDGREVRVASALQLSSAAAPSELRAFTDALATTVATSIQTSESSQ